MSSAARAEQAALLARPGALAQNTDTHHADASPAPLEEGAAASPVETRTVALVVIAVIVALFGLRTGAAFFIPLLLSLFLIVLVFGVIAGRALF